MYPDADLWPLLAGFHRGGDANPLGLELQGEIRKAIDNGYAREVIDVGHAACRYPASAKGFRDIVAAYNLAMADFHHRFPALKAIEPPALNRTDPSVARNERYLCASYDFNLRCIGFRELDDFGTWDRDYLHDGTWRDAPSRGFGGLLAHEYGHHLSIATVRPATWTLELEAMLQANGHVPGNCSPRTSQLSYDESFPLRVGRRVRDMGIGYSAGASALEFAAEAIAWRLHPDYGATPGAPRMPRYLENWVHECFPFLDNGQIPEPSCEFNPDAIKLPVYRNRKVEWVAAAELRAPTHAGQPDCDPWPAVLATAGKSRGGFAGEL